MQDYKPNSHRFKEEQSKALPEKREIQKVTKGAVKVKKKGAVEGAIDAFVKEDIPNIKTYLVSDVIIPTIKNTIWDAFTNTLDMILYGGTGHSRKNGPGSSRVPYVSYNKMSSNNGRAGSSRGNEPVRARYDFSYITFQSKQDADAVLSQMDEIMEAYNLVRVADLYDLIGQTCDYTDQKYGWQNIRNASVKRGRDGYYIELPKPLPID